MSPTRSCPECNKPVLRRSNAKYCSKVCQQRFLGRRHYVANKDRYREQAHVRRSDPQKWSREKAKNRARLKTSKWREWYSQHNKNFRTNTVHGRVISLNAHVRNRRQSTLVVDWHEVLNKFGELNEWVCDFCSSTDDLTFDHIASFCEGGEHVIENLQILCRSCNSTKGCYERWTKKALAS